MTAATCRSQRVLLPLLDASRAAASAASKPHRSKEYLQNQKVEDHIKGQIYSHSTAQIRRSLEDGKKVHVCSPAARGRAFLGLI